MTSCQPVRSQPFIVPAAFLPWIVCSHCDRRIADMHRPDTYVVHVDAIKDEHGNTKASSYLACSPACRDALIEAGQVQLALEEVEEAKDDQG